MTSAAYIPPHHRLDVGAVVVGERTVVFDGHTGALHWLSASAAAIWVRCDGEASVAAITDEVASDFEVAPSMLAADVARTIDALADLGLLGEVGGPDAIPATHDEIEYVTVSCKSCVEGLDHLGWTTPFAVQIGNTRLGVRSNSGEVDALLRRLLADHLVDDAAVEANFSVRLVDPPWGRGRRELHQLYDDKHLRSGSSFGGDVVGHLLTALANRRQWSDGIVGLVAFDLPGLVLGDGVHLGPLLWEIVPTIARRSGGRLLSRPVAIDPDTGEIVVPPALEVDRSAWAELTARFGDQSARGPAAPGRYPLREIVLGRDDRNEGELEDALAATVSASALAGPAALDVLRASIRIVLDDAGAPRFRWVDRGVGEREALRPSVLRSI